MGDYRDDYAKLHDYILETKNSNPRTTCVCKPGSFIESQDRKFQRFYVCLDALKKR